MKFYKYINEKKLIGTMIGYSISPRSIKRVTEYITSFLDRNNIKYSLNETPHISVSQITGVYEKDEMVRAMMKLDKNISLNIKELKIFHGPIAKKDFIALEFNNSNEFRNSVKTLNEKFPEFRSFPGGMLPHTSLVSCELNSIDPYVWNDISKGFKNLKLVKKIKTDGISLFNNKFTPEFIYKG